MKRLEKLSLALRILTLALAMGFFIHPFGRAWIFYYSLGLLPQEWRYQHTIMRQMSHLGEDAVLPLQLNYTKQVEHPDLQRLTARALGEIGRAIPPDEAARTIHQGDVFIARGCLAKCFKDFNEREGDFAESLERVETAIDLALERNRLELNEDLIKQLKRHDPRSRKRFQSKLLSLLVSDKSGLRKGYWKRLDRQDQEYLDSIILAYFEHLPPSSDVSNYVKTLKLAYTTKINERARIERMLEQANSNHIHKE